MEKIVSITNCTRTQEEIDTEISRLTKIRGTIREAAFSFVTVDDKRSAIDAQIMVLEERMGSEAIDNEFDGVENQEYLIVSAANALDWMRGEDPAPSEEWLELVGDGAEPVN